jgi:hypothetical protein
MVFALLAIVAGVQLPAKIIRSTTFGPGTVFVPSRGKPALAIVGDGITVDFGGMEMCGSDPKTRPDQRAGTGIEVRGRNITLKNVRVHGYKVGLIARDCPGLRILGGDLSYNWKQHLASTPEQEDESDWMSYHQNEKDEWLQYGAGIYLRGCQKPEIKGVRITGGQCGLMMTQCDDGLVWNNDFSFLSGIGIGLYRSSRNRIQNNRIDWCVRGYSHGVYNRGQDSAGILVYEQSNGNTFAYNSVTHGGDGFFLWAGQTTMVVRRGLEFIGVMGVADTLRPEAKDALVKLRAMGVRRTVMLSGDNLRVAQAIGREVGIDEPRAGGRRRRHRPEPGPPPGSPHAPPERRGRRR